MEFCIGQKVSLKSPLPYLKTIDPVPMLRPPDLVYIEEIGVIIGIRAMELVEVKFRRGIFLISIERLSIRLSEVEVD